MKKIALACLILVACATPLSTKIEITGESLVSLSTQFDAVSRVMTDGCIAKKYTVTTCTNFTNFSNKFKASYPAARTIWISSTQYEDKGLAAAANTAFSSLVTDLAPFLAMIGGGK